MKLGKKIIVLGIAYFLLGMSSNVFAEWYDEIAGKKISYYDGEITKLETKKDVNALQDLLKTFREDLEKTKKIYEVATENVRNINSLIKKYQQGLTDWAETVYIKDPFGKPGIDLSAPDMLETITETPKQTNVIYQTRAKTKEYVTGDLIKKTEAALKQLGVAPISATYTTSTKTFTTTSTTTEKPIHTRLIFPAAELPSPVPVTHSLKNLQGQLKDLTQQKQDWEETFKTLSTVERQSMQQEVDQLDKQIEDVKKQIDQLQEKKVEKKQEQPKQDLSDEEMIRKLQIEEYVDQLNNVKSLVDYNNMLMQVPADLRQDVKEATKNKFEDLRAKAHPNFFEKK